VKEVWVEGERFIPSAPLRTGLCHNPEAAERDRIRREEIVARLQEQLSQGGLSSMLKSPIYRRFLHVDGSDARIDLARVEADARLDGKWVLTTDTVLPSDEVALAYKGLWRIEQAFRHLKSGLEVRPVFHWTADRVHSHVLVCFLALVLESALQRRLTEQDPLLSYSQVRRDLDRFRAVAIDADGTRYLLRTELSGNAYAAFKAVGLRPPTHLQPLN